MVNEVIQEIDYDENAPIEEDDPDQNFNGENRTIETLRNIPEINPYKLLSKKRKFIHFCFRKVIMISFIPTLIYNLFWIIKLKKISFENLVNFDFSEFRNIILTACYIVLAKGIFILFFPQIMCGTENGINDFSYILVILKTLTTYICSKIICYNMKKKLYSDNSYNPDDEIYYWIKLYYKFEYIYIKGIYSILLMILLIVLIVVIKELSRAIRYVL